MATTKRVFYKATEKKPTATRFVEKDIPPLEDVMLEMRRTLAFARWFIKLSGKCCKKSKEGGSFTNIKIFQKGIMERLEGIRKDMNNFYKELEL